jgi:hypothetical protein
VWKRGREGRWGGYVGGIIDGKYEVCDGKGFGKVGRGRTVGRTVWKGK